MLKNFFAFYGLMRFLEHTSEQPPEGKNNDGCAGCGCLILIIFIILACL